MKTFTLQTANETDEFDGPEREHPDRPYIPYLDLPQNDWDVGRALSAIRRLTDKITGIQEQKSLYMDRFDQQIRTLEDRVQKIRARLQDYARRNRADTGQASVSVPEGRITYSEPSRLKVNWDDPSVLDWARKYNLVFTEEKVDKTAGRKLIGELDTLPEFATRESAPQLSVQIDEETTDFDLRGDDDLPF